MMTTMTDDLLLTVHEVAERLRMHPVTVRNWLREGRLRGYRFGSDKMGWRVKASDLDTFIESMANMPAETEDGEAR